MKTMQGQNLTHTRCARFLRDAEKSVPTADQ